MRVTEAMRQSMYVDWCVRGHGYANIRRLAKAHNVSPATYRRHVAIAEKLYDVVLVPKGYADHPNTPVGTGNPWGEHPEYPVQDWQHEVSNDDTRRGYWAWVRAKLEEEANED